MHSLVYQIDGIRDGLLGLLFSSYVVTLVHCWTNYLPITNFVNRLKYPLRVCAVLYGNGRSGGRWLRGLSSTTDGQFLCVRLRERGRAAKFE